jgi:hypothetical protein
MVSERTRKELKKMFIENLMDRMIALYGFENELTIRFCELCEKDAFALEILEMIVDAHEASPMI